jgi:hypothetical protein
MIKNKVVLVLLLSSCSLLLIAYNVAYKYAVTTNALLITIISITLFLLPNHLLSKQILFPFKKHLQLFLKTTTHLIIHSFSFILLILITAHRTLRLLFVYLGKWINQFSDQIISILIKPIYLPKITYPKIHKHLRTAAVHEEAEIFEDESISDFFRWWVRTPILPYTFREWVFAFLFVAVFSLFFYLSFERLLSGYRGIEMFYVWAGKY